MLSTGRLSRVRQMRAARIAALVVAAWWGRPCVAQTGAGHVDERVTSTTDTAQHFALYLPPGYTTERRWPILLVLDPRGRALLALRLFQDAAARLGWIVMSSYNTLSDGPPEPNVAAVNAMLASAHARWSIDTSRLYLAGFSGTARAALAFAVALRGHVAGVIAAGGALGFTLGGPETAFAGDSTFAYFGAAGTRDFNYEEVLAAAGRAPALRRSPAVTRYEAEARRLAERDQQQGLALPRLFAWARSQRDPPPLESLVAKLGIAALQRTVERGDSVEAASARRLLARLWVNLAFYEPRAYLATGSPDRALRMLEAAASIGPIEGEACALLRQALTATSAERPARLVRECAAQP